jgi:redox-regulated HSP33 family molecular chaperone
MSGITEGLNDLKTEEIKRLERERDRNLAIHCNYVAAKYQRMIEKIEKEMKS